MVECQKMRSFSQDIGGVNWSSCGWTGDVACDRGRFSSIDKYATWVPYLHQSSPYQCFAVRRSTHWTNIASGGLRIRASTCWAHRIGHRPATLYL